MITNKDKKKAYLNKNKVNKNKGRGRRNRNFKRENYSRNQDREDGEKALTAVNQELLLVATADKKFERNTWIADSGSSGHMVNHLEGFTKMKTKSSRTVLTGSGKSMTIQKTGIWKGTIKTSDRREMPIILQDVDYVLELMCNLLSTSQMQKNGWKVMGERDTF